MAIDAERHARTIAGLLDSPHDALLCSSATGVLLLTGYWPVMSNSIAVFSREGQVRLILPEDEVELAQQTSAAELIPYSPAGLHTLQPPVEQLKNPLRAALQSLGLQRAAIGLELQHGLRPSSYAASADFRAALPLLLEDLLPDASTAACDELLANMESVKTATEIQLLKSACRVAADGFAVASSSVRAGVRETEIAANLASAFAKSTSADSLQRSYGYFFCMSGPNSAKAAAAYARTRQREVQQGDLVMIHANTCADGYWTDITRTYTAGEPSAQQRDMRAAIDEARSAGLQSIRPGVSAAEVDRTVRAVMTARGFGDAFKHSTGHEVGFAACDPNGRPRIHPDSPDVLAAGMTFNVEPAAYFDGYGGMRHCDVVAVTPTGAEVLTDF